MPTSPTLSLALSRPQYRSPQRMKAFASSAEEGCIDPLANGTWDDLLRAFPEATVFHSSAWARVLARTYGHRPLYFQLERGGEAIALVPLMEVRSRLTGCRGVCIPFADLCKPLVAAGSNAEEEVTRALASLASDRGWKFAEIRGEFGINHHDQASAEPAFYAHELDLRGGLESVQSAFSNSVKRALRKAERAGLTAQVSSSWQAMEAFVRLHALTRRGHGAPPQPLSFFRNIHREILEPGSGFVVTVAHEHGGRPIAAAVFFHFGKNAIYKFGASDPSALDHRPNNLAIATGIETAVARGMESLHFGRSDSHQDGLRRFKRGWGAAEKPLSYRKFEPKTGQWLPSEVASGGLRKAIFRHLPAAPSRWAGRLLYPHLD